MTLFIKLITPALCEALNALQNVELGYDILRIIVGIIELFNYPLFLNIIKRHCKKILVLL